MKLSVTERDRDVDGAVISKVKITPRSEDNTTDSLRLESMTFRSEKHGIQLKDHISIVVSALCPRIFRIYRRQ